MKGKRYATTPTFPLVPLAFEYLPLTQVITSVYFLLVETIICKLLFQHLRKPPNPNILNDKTVM